MVHLCGCCRVPGAMLVPARDRAFYPVCSFLGGFVPDGDEFAEACAGRVIGLDDGSCGRITPDSQGRTNLEQRGAGAKAGAPRHCTRRQKKRWQHRPRARSKANCTQRCSAVAALQDSGSFDSAPITKKVHTHTAAASPRGAQINSAPGGGAPQEAPRAPRRGTAGPPSRRGGPTANQQPR